MTRRTTASDVARAAGVSRSTVSFVLNATQGQTISEGVRERVLREADRLGYQPDPHARALASGQSRIVLILLPEWPVEYLLRGLLDQASSALDEAGYSLVTMDSRTSGHATPLWETLRPDVALAIDQIPGERASAITRAGIPLLLPDSSRLESFDKGPRLQLEHLASRGHRSIAFASTTVRGMERLNAGRLARVRQLAADAGIAFREEAVTADTATAVVRTWRDRGITGVAAFNDDVAAHVVGAAMRDGLRVPGDLAVIGHDDTPLASLFIPSLSSVHFDVAELGHGFALQALAAARGEPPPPPLDAAAVKAHVVERESS